jgi:hypothetical protein
MKANELRIGNYLQCGTSCFTTVYEIVFDRREGHLINGQIPESHCKPIQLTPEILEKTGFDVRIEEHSNKWYIGINTITHDWLFDLVWIHGDSCPFYKNGFHKIYFLHQLQNLYFALTGEELNIQL